MGVVSCKYTSIIYLPVDFISFSVLSKARIKGPSSIGNTCPDRLLLETLVHTYGTINPTRSCNFVAALFASCSIANKSG